MRPRASLEGKGEKGEGWFFQPYGCKNKFIVTADFKRERRFYE
jgi:hypothetical protein